MTDEAFNKIQDELTRAQGVIKSLQTQLAQALTGKVPKHQVADPGTIWIESIVSHRTGKGLVNLRWGNLSAQLSVEEARTHAHGILQAAEAAETDALLNEFFAKQVGLEPAKIAGVLEDFRRLRERNQL